MKQRYYQVVIVMVSLIFFSGSLRNELTSWDDQVYITNNQHIKGITSKNIQYIFTHPYASNYNPFHLVLYMFEYRAFKLNPTGYHSLSILLHLTVVLLVFNFLSSLFKSHRMGFYCALVFAVHPYQSEVVCWASAQKDLLFMTFLLPAFIFYIRYLDIGKPRFFLLTCFFYLLSVCSKPTALCFPAILLVMDLYQDRKMNRNYWKRMALLFMISLVMGLITLKTQRGAISPQAFFNIAERFAIACHNLIQYTFGFFAPFHLSAYYSYPEKINGQLPVYYWISFLVIIAAILYLVIRVKNNSVLRFAVLWIVLSSALTLQILPVGSAVRADRYMYLPSIGFAIIVVNYTSTFAKNFSTYILTAFVMFLSIFTLQLNKRWKDSMTLYDSVLNRDPKAWLMLNNRGALFMDKKEYDLAVTDFKRAITANPTYYLPYSNLANCFKEQGDFDSSLNYYDQSLAIKPDAKTFLNRGVVFAMKKDYQFAIRDFDSSIKMDQEYSLAYRNRGMAKILINKKEEGCNDLQMALKLGDEKAFNSIRKYCQ